MKYYSSLHDNKFALWYKTVAHQEIQYQACLVLNSIKQFTSLQLLGYQFKWNISDKSAEKGPKQVDFYNRQYIIHKISY